MSVVKNLYATTIQDETTNQRIRELYRRVGNVGGIRHGAWMPDQTYPKGECTPRDKTQ
jgi:cyanophycinase-like exopeptidase